jgi:ribosomal protein L11 methyltransferase
LGVAWTEVIVLAPLEWHELVAEALHVGPCTSVAFGRPSPDVPEPPVGHDYVRTYIAEESDTPQQRAAIGAALQQLARASGIAELARAKPTYRRVPAQEFATAWRKGWRPLRVGALRIVTPDWRGRLRAGERKLVLEPGGAFGTGRHATTRACLRAIQARIRPGERVLDAGCGNGILAVASVLCGASSALGFDFDASAIPYARELAELNGVGAACEFRAGGFELLADVEREFDGCLANIYADLIQAHATLLARALRIGAWFAFSGCARDKRDRTRAAIDAAGLAIERLATRDGWDTFVGTRAR